MECRGYGVFIRFRVPMVSLRGFVLYIWGWHFPARPSLRDPDDWRCSKKRPTLVWHDVCETDLDMQSKLSKRRQVTVFQYCQWQPCQLCHLPRHEAVSQLEGELESSRKLHPPMVPLQVCPAKGKRCFQSGEGWSEDLLHHPTQMHNH